MVQLNITATPIPSPTPAYTPTPDNRGIEQLLSQAQTQSSNSDWTNAIDSALKLRKQDPNYHAVEIDGILFMALRNRGMDKIGKQADLEGGMYDLSQAARFGPLDSEAQGYMNWASLYLTGASFWELDWKQAAFYFQQVAASLPNLRDGSGMTAGERYRLALIGMGDELSKKGTWCDAVTAYQEAQAMGTDANADAGVAQAIEHCPSAAPATEGTDASQATPVQ
jgi:hypothetical protein